MADRPFQVFINLVTFDQEVRSVKNTIEVLKKEIDELKIQEVELNKDMQIAKDYVVVSRKEVDLQELDMKELDMQEREKKKQLDGVSGYREYQSFKTEMDTIHEKQLAQEQVVLSVWNTLENAEKRLEEKQQAFKEQVQKLHEDIQKRHQELKEKQVQLTEQLEQRSAKEQAVPEEWLEKYNIMKARVENPVVPVLSGSCGACFFTLTSQDLIRAKRGALMQCKGCYRLLYSSEAMDKQEQKQSV